MYLMYRKLNFNMLSNKKSTVQNFILNNVFKYSDQNFHLWLSKYAKNKNKKNCVITFNYKS